MNIDTTLNAFKVPGMSGVNLPFGTKNPNDVPVWDDEAVMNAAMPFMRQRPFIVNEDSVTSAIETPSLFVLEASGITLTLGSGGFIGCECRVINISDGQATVDYGDTERTLKAGEELSLRWNGTAWQARNDALGGYLNAYDFGDPGDTGTYPTPQDFQNALTQYALGETGISDKTEIFNGTRVKNIFDNHVWILTNTPQTNPPVFDWADDGQDVVGFATQDTAGIVKGSRNIITDPLTGRIEVVSYGQLFGGGRDLKKVFGVQSAEAVMAILHAKCNGEGNPDFWDLCIGDYIDIPSLVIDSVVYTNVRILVSGFNHYKNLVQDAENQNRKNHILFTFDKIVMRRRMNPSDNNTGGYPASELRGFLEGAGGDGSGLFAQGVKNAIGDYLYTVRKYASIKGNMAWGDYTLFPPTALEVGTTLYWSTDGTIYPDDEDDSEGLQKKFPIFSVRRTRKLQIGQNANYNSWWWLSSSYSASAAYFCRVSSYGTASISFASSIGGCAPAFCVA